MPHMRPLTSFLHIAFALGLSVCACGNAENSSNSNQGDGDGGDGDDGSDGGSPGDGDTSLTGGASGASGGTMGTGGDDASSGGSGASSGGWTLDTSTEYGACLNYLEQSCRKRRSCEGATDEELCIYTRLAADWCPDYFFSEGSNTTIDQVNACADQWSERSCDDVNKNINPTCGFPAGDIPTGEPCAFGLQCEEGVCGGDTCGTCGVIGQPGQECNGVNPPVKCPSGTECTSDGCTPSLEFGLEPGSSCERYGQCVEGYYCLENPDGSNTCQEEHTVGETCIDFTDCGPGLHCDSDTKICTLSPGVDEPCAAFSCAIGLTCNAQQICELQAQLGESCTTVPPFNERGNCAFEYECFCQDAECATGRCFTRRYAGQPCNDGEGQCGFGLACEGGLCVETGTQGLFEQWCGQ